jgi:hypothetical protein
LLTACRVAGFGAARGKPRTRRAQAREEHAEVARHEAARGARQAQAVELGAEHVFHRFAALAHEVVVALDARVVAAGGAGLRDAAGESELDERLERAVDGGAVETGERVSDVRVQRVHRRVVRAAEERLEQRAALDRHGQRALAQRRAGALEGGGDVSSRGSVHRPLL